jgi:hypothetical protein
MLETTSPMLAFVIGVEDIRQVRLRKAWKSRESAVA